MFLKWRLSIFTVLEHLTGWYSISAFLPYPSIICWVSTKCRYWWLPRIQRKIIHSQIWWARSLVYGGKWSFMNRRGTILVCRHGIRLKWYFITCVAGMQTPNNHVLLGTLLAALMPNHINTNNIVCCPGCWLLLCKNLCKIQLQCLWLTSHLTGLLLSY